MTSWLRYQIPLMFHQFDNWPSVMMEIITWSLRASMLVLVWLIWIIKLNYVGLEWIHLERNCLRSGIWAHDLQSGEGVELIADCYCLDSGNWIIRDWPRLKTRARQLEYGIFLDFMAKVKRSSKRGQATDLLTLLTEYFYS